jgi:hypothetical protein
VRRASDSVSPAAVSPGSSRRVTAAAAERVKACQSPVSSPPTWPETTRAAVDSAPRAFAVAAEAPGSPGTGSDAMSSR